MKARLVSCMLMVGLSASPLSFHNGATNQIFRASPLATTPRGISSEARPANTVTSII